jgi:hypothetical protein
MNGRDDAVAGEVRFGGVDWSWERHAVCVVDGAGAVIERFEAEHSAAGLQAMVRRLRRAGAARVAIERGDGPVVDALLAGGLEVVVVSSRQVKALRLRYGTAGNKDDRFDAFVLADVLRSDGHRLASLTRTVRRRSACGRWCGPARTWSSTGSRWATSCGRTCWPPFPARWGSSQRSIPRLA